jgi:hypothetical protein
LLALLMAIGCARDPRAPFNIRLEAESDSLVKVIWSVPVSETPDAYEVAFRAVGESTFSLAGETTANLWIHNPQGRAGWYRVTSRFGEERHEGSSTPSTVPVYTDTLVLSDLNASGNSGLGWDRTSGRARTLPMDRASSAVAVDLYVTDFKPAGIGQPPYSLASPEMGPADPGGVVPPGTWRSSEVTDPMNPDTNALPPYSPLYWFNYSDVNPVPCVIACRTADGYYTLIKACGVAVPDGWLKLVTWFQPVPGLRLVPR